jgi:HSP20 family protein
MMNLIPWRRNGAVDTVHDFRRELDRMTERFFGEPFGRWAFGEGKEWVPSVDVEGNEKEVVVKADLPGVEPKDIEVSVVGDVMTLRGSRKEEQEKTEKGYHHVERFEGEFYREIPLPAGVDTEHIEANSAKGVLTIRIPKKPEAEGKKVEVTAA